MPRKTIFLAADLHQRLRVRAVQTKRRIGDCTDEAIAQWLSGQKQRKGKSK